MDTGAFITSRKIFNNPIWQNVLEFRLFFLIYGKAMFSDEGVKIGNVQLRQGQWLRSYRNLQFDLEYLENRAVKRYGLSSIKRAIEHLSKENRIMFKACEYGTLFTVVNYRKYQTLDNYSSSLGTAMEQGENRDGTIIRMIRKQL